MEYIPVIRLNVFVNDLACAVLLAYERTLLTDRESLKC